MLPAGHLQGRGWPGAGFAELLYFINSDLRPAQDSSWDADTATVRVPPRTAMVYVLPALRQAEHHSVGSSIR